MPFALFCETLKLTEQGTYLTYLNSGGFFVLSTLFLFIFCSFYCFIHDLDLQC